MLQKRFDLATKRFVRPALTAEEIGDLVLRQKPRLVKEFGDPVPTVGRHRMTLLV